MANLSDNKYVYNKTFSYKAISGGNMRVGSLVRIIQENSYFKNKLGIVVVNGTWSADIHVIGSNRMPRIDKELLEVLCK